MSETDNIRKRIAAGKCRFNDGVQCENSWAPAYCTACGWNPRVQERRKQRKRRNEH